MNNRAEYWKLLSSPLWKLKRKEILERDANKCICCGSVDKLHIHHKQYHFSKTLQVFKKPWEYNNELLTTFCATCHDNGHEVYKVPTKYF
jgi:5-methylcytosine-specific restriction endonuclease McrA